MIIRSSFRDYYDRVTGGSPDPSVVYERETDEVAFANPFIRGDLDYRLPLGLYPSGKIPDGFRPGIDRVHCMFQVLGFCGEYVLCLTDGRASTSPFYDLTLFGDDILSLDWSTRRRNGHTTTEREAVTELVERNHGVRDVSLFRSLNTPIFAAPVTSELTRYERRHEGLYTVKCVKNPCLADYNFVRYLDAYSAFTQIENFISGVLGQPEVPTNDVPNDIKITKAGFDGKTSFRKRS